MASGREEAGGEGVELFEDAAAAPVELGAFLEDQIDIRVAEHREGADFLHPRHAEEGHGEGVGDLVLDILRGASGPFGEDDLLVVPEVGDGVHGHGVAGVGAGVPVKGSHPNPPADEKGEEKQDDELLVKAEMDEAVHRKGGMRISEGGSC